MPKLQTKHFAEVGAEFYVCNAEANEVTPPLKTFSKADEPQVIAIE